MSFPRITIFAAVIAACAALPSLAACKGNDASASTSGTSASITAAANAPVAVTVDDKGFTPSSVSFKKGDHAQLVFTRTTDATCATEVVFPELKITKPLPLKQPVTIDVPTSDAKTLTFQCGMGMFKSKVVIQ
jgi:plastocyanin domain-containing protein